MTKDIEVAGQVTDTAGQSYPAGTKADQRGKTRSAAGTANMTAEGHSHGTARGQPQGIARGHAEHQSGKGKDPETDPGLLIRPKRSVKTETNPLTKIQQKERRPPRSEGNLYPAAPVAVAAAAVAVTASLTV